MSNPDRFTKKPVTIDAILWTGENVKEVMDFLQWRNADHSAETGLVIRTLEGAMYAGVGDYIIKGVKGEFYPCKPDIFAATYSPAVAPTEAAAMAATVPAGFRLVPIVPTEAMIQAGACEDTTTTDSYQGEVEVSIGNGAALRVYSEMLKAAPQTPMVGQPAGDDLQLLLDIARSDGYHTAMGEVAARAQAVAGQPAEPSPGAGWQSMESAPRDGTHILAWLPDSETCYVVCWADASNGIRKELGSARPGWHLAWDGYLFEAPAPDYWHPLPDGPELDAWKCERCHGEGWHWEAASINHGKEIGVENVDLKTSCDDCEGVGWCGPDADRAAPKGDSNG